MGVSLDRALVFAAMSIFLFFGLWIFVAPGALESLGILMTTPEARVDVRATYGGLELGMACFLAMCVVREEWTRIGLAASTCVIGGLGLARLLGIAIEGGGTPLMWLFVALEATIVAILVWAYRRGSSG